MTEEHAASTDPAVPHDGMAHVLESIQSVHDRLSEIESLARTAIGGSAPGTPGTPGTRVPAWRRPSDGEARWQVTLTTAVAIVFQLPISGRALLVHPGWIIPAIQGLLLVGLVVANPRRINRESRLLRSLSLTLATLISVGNAWSASVLVLDIAHGKGPSSPSSLLVTGLAVWLTNVIVFALWYWEFDQGGPVARALATKPKYPDFLFANMTVWDDQNLCPKDWKPTFADYLYLAFTNATAFSPTDTLPLSRPAKMAMTLQALISLITGTLVVARAVNIL